MLKYMRLLCFGVALCCLLPASGLTQPLDAPAGDTADEPTVPGSPSPEEPAVTPPATGSEQPAAGGPETPADSPDSTGPSDGDQAGSGQDSSTQGYQDPTVGSSVKRFQDGDWLAGVVGAIFVLVMGVRLMFKPKSKLAKRVIALVAALVVSAVPLHYGVALSWPFVMTMVIAALASGGTAEEAKDALPALRAKLIR